MRTLISFSIFIGIKIFIKIFYKVEIKWLSESKGWDRIRYIVFLNHTSLYEPLYIGVLPIPFIWRISRKLIAPGADKTLDRPLVGIFWKLMGPGIISITRKRDKSWFRFMQAVHNRAVIVMAAEGRMKRRTGLDVNGKPMTVRSGVADVLEQINEGNMIVAYSGGLHHVQVPGQRLPKLFKTLKINFELLDIADYKSKFNTEGIQWKRDVVEDFQHRLEANCPQADSTPQIKTIKD
jgi:1-acyl-sn-glycerol-3-phosphate acyltransferase